MAMSFEEAQRITNQKLAKQRKGYLAENAYRQSDENRERIKNRLVSIAEATTPLGDVQTGIDAKTAYDEGRYLDAAGNAAMIVAGYTPFGPLAKAGKAGYKSLNQANKYRKFKNEAAKRSGPLSPHYMNRTTGDPRMDKLANQNVANMSMLPDGKYHPYEEKILSHNGLKGKKHIWFSGQSPARARKIDKEGALDEDFFVTDNPQLAERYNPDNMMMFMSDINYMPPVPRTKIIDNLTTAGGGQYKLNTEEMNDFLRNVKTSPINNPKRMDDIDPFTKKSLRQSPVDFKKYLGS